MRQLMQPTQPAAAHTLFTLRIVYFAMIGGVVIFAAIALLVLPPPESTEPGRLFTILGLLPPGMIAIWLIVGRFLGRGLRARLAEATHDEAANVIHRGFFTRSLVGGALGEAYSFFAIVVYMLTAAPVALLALGFGLIALLAQLPTADRLYRFAEMAYGHWQP